MWHTPWFPGRILVSPRDRGPTGSRRSSYRRQSAVFRLEALEGRALLSTVTSLLDNGAPETLRYQIEHDSAGETITFGPTLFSGGAQTITLSQAPGFGELQINQDLKISGPGAGLLTISGSDASRVFDVQSGTVTISGLTITHGSRAAGSGGGIWNKGTLNLTDSTLSGNFADSDGGGIYNEGKAIITNSLLSDNKVNIDGGGIWNKGTLNLTDSTLRGNFAPHNGGGIYNSNSGTVEFTNSTVSGNRANNAGGGIANSGTVNSGTVKLTNCTLSGNEATLGVGGGIINGGNLIITSSTLSRNGASQDGGGIYNAQAGKMTMTNSTLVGNVASQSGGGIYNKWPNPYQGSMTLTNCTLADNKASQSGGGIYNSSTLTLTNTIVAQVAHDSGGDVFNSVLGKILGNHNLIDVQVYEDGSRGLADTLAGDPKLAPLGDYGGPTQTMALLPDSPAIGAGTTTDYPGTNTPITTDQRGLPLDSPTPDIGAFQSQGFTLTPVAGSTPQQTPPGAKFANPLAVTVKAVNPVEPVNGGVVRFAFAAPTINIGASATLSAAAVTIAGGVASVTATANSGLGNYSVTAMANGAETARFDLTNTRDPTPVVPPGPRKEAPSLVVTTTQDVMSDTDKLTSLREALAYAQSLNLASTVTFSSALFGATPQTITLTLGALTLTQNATIAIVGPGATKLTIRGTGEMAVGGDGGIFRVDSGVTSAISGMTLTQGRATGKGGAIVNAGKLTLSDDIIASNSARYGGGLANTSLGTATLANDTFTDNTAASSGGAIYNEGSLKINASRLASNSATEKGGAVYNFMSSFVAMTDTGVGENKATDGAGIYNDGYFTITRGFIRHNQATGRGGAIYNARLLAIAGTPIQYNTADYGGALYNDGGAMTLAGVEISQNHARKPKGGGGIATHGGLEVPVRFQVFYNLDGDSNENDWQVL
jgi:predicted outer membrane repeat protein